MAEAGIERAAVGDVDGVDNGEWWEQCTGLVDMVTATVTVM